MSFFSLLRALFLSAFVALLLIVALVPDLFPLPTEYADKMLHIWTCTIFLIWSHLRFPNPKILVFSGMMLLLAGVGLEIVQGMIPGRQVSLEDIAANIVGITFGTVVAVLLRRGIRAGLTDS